MIRVSDGIPLIPVYRLPLKTYRLAVEINSRNTGIRKKNHTFFLKEYREAASKSYFLSGRATKREGGGGAKRVCH